ncbi:MAG: metalloregulator ArsR/SmtB family transcription factor [Alphaproteobacteria bacterium]|nr:metalloregulator ArsR/SmtB family transcription factor [Alphaproteobacteria bacterium]
MTYASALTTLADPTRRKVVEKLAAGPLSVNAIAAGLPVSRPAVSQHLKALTDAGFVQVRSRGTSRVYTLRPEALGELRTYVDHMWRQALAAVVEDVRHPPGGTVTGDIDERPVPPVIVTVRVACNPSEAFRRFTRDFGCWWPIATHTYAKAVSCAMEPYVGGRLYETTADGEIHPWGRITVFEPGRRVAFTWHPGRTPSAEQIVEITFRPDDDGCSVRLEHRGWAADARKRRDSYDEGWIQVLGGHFAKYAPA